MKSKRSNGSVLTFISVDIETMSRLERFSPLLGSTMTSMWSITMIWFVYKNLISLIKHQVCLRREKYSKVGPVSSQGARKIYWLEKKFVGKG